MNRKSIAFCLLISFLPLKGLYAQDPMSLYFMETVPQVSRINPAIQPRANFYVALPSASVAFKNDFAFKDIYQDQKFTPLEEQFDYKKFYRKLGKSWNIDAGVEANLLGFGKRTSNGKGYFSVNFSIKADIRNDIPSDIFEITKEGLTGTLDFSPLRQKTLLYKQISLGYSREINDRLTIGVNLRPILGIGAFSSSISKFKVITNSEQWTFEVKGDLYSSLPIIVTDKPDNDFPDIEVRDFDKTSDYTKYLTNFSNPGLAADFGATYKMTDRLTLSAALNNVGFIKWNDDLNSISVNGSFDFEGIVIDDPNGNHDDYFDQLGDELETAIDYKTGHEKFSTSLTPSLYVGASYHLTNTIVAGFLSRSMFLKNGINQNFSLSLNLQPYKMVALNLSLNQQVRGGTYAGMGFTVFLGPLQIFVLSDYIPLTYSKVSFDNGDKIPIPEHFKEITAMVGVNLVFGKKGYRDRPMLDRF